MTTTNNPPKNWKDGFTSPHKLTSGEQPFFLFGSWHLYVYNTDIKDLEVYDFSTDLMTPYKEFQDACDRSRDLYMDRRNNEMSC